MTLLSEGHSDSGQAGMTSLSLLATTRWFRRAQPPYFGAYRIPQ
ncbi:MAG: hypothetical protein SFU91_03580 [Chloroherpetonaceae bacterium]|nr:hypothetical protein [Chloroherpetonaceae bacterium]